MRLGCTFRIYIVLQIALIVPLGFMCKRLGAHFVPVGPAAILYLPQWRSVSGILPPGRRGLRRAVLTIGGASLSYGDWFVLRLHDHSTHAPRNAMPNGRWAPHRLQLERAVVAFNMACLIFSTRLPRLRAALYLSAAFFFINHSCPASNVAAYSSSGVVGSY